MTAILIVIIAILMICCCIMLGLYFSIRKDADTYELKYEEYRGLYNEECNTYRSKFKEWDDEKYQRHLLEKSIEEKDLRIKRPGKDLDDNAIRIVNIHLRTEWHEGYVDIPMEFLQDSDMPDGKVSYEIVKFDSDLQDKLTRKIGMDILKSSTGFALNYDTFNNCCRLFYKYPVFEKSEVLKKYLRQINPDDDLAIWNLIQTMSKEEYRR